MMESHFLNSLNRFCFVKCAGPGLGLSPQENWNYLLTETIL